MQFCGYDSLSYHQTLGQMLLINQQLDKLTVAWTNFQIHGLLIPYPGVLPAKSEHTNILRVLCRYNASTINLLV